MQNGQFLIHVEEFDSGAEMTCCSVLIVFNKFYRAGNEETRNTKGTGLGLYIVKNLVKMHQGTIKINNMRSSITFNIIIISYIKIFGKNF